MIAAVGSGQSCREVAATFGVGVSTVVRWRQQQRQTGNVAARPRGGSKPRALVEFEAWLIARVAAEPHLTTRALAAELADQGRRVSHVTVWNRLQGEQLTHKKTYTPASRTVLTSRAAGSAGRPHQGRIDQRRLAFIDETWAKTNMAPLRGWFRRGQRLVAKVPHGQWKTMTFVAALRCDRIDAPCVIDGPIDGQTFLGRAPRIQGVLFRCDRSLSEATTKFGRSIAFYRCEQRTTRPVVAVSARRPLPETSHVRGKRA